jgi:hypothetical protein
MVEKEAYHSSAPHPQPLSSEERGDYGVQYLLRLP